MKNSLEILHLPIASVKPSPHSARQHSAAQRRKLKTLIEKFGQVTPILIDNANVIIDGHAVYDAVRDLGYDEIAVVAVHNRSDAEIRALRLAVNRIGEETKWDNAKLKGEFEDLLQLGFELDLTGFDTVEIDMTLDVDPPVANTVEEVAAAEIEPAAGPTVTRPGDIWCLGRHVVGCGDARDADHLRRLMAGQQAAVVFTDPPYNVPVDGFVSGLGRTTHREFAMASGEMSRTDFVAFLSAFFAALKTVIADGGIAFVCMDWRHIGELLEAGLAQALELKNLCVWTKSNAGMGSFYRSQHELIFVFKCGTAPHQNHFLLGQHGRSRTNVWAYKGVNAFGKDRMELLGVHPTCKPVAMIADALRDVSRRGEVVIDPFLGSGSTLIAAEETGRVCVGNEIDPTYVDVAVRRWQRVTGRDAVHTATGETFDAVADPVGKTPDALLTPAVAAQEGRSLPAELTDEVAAIAVTTTAASPVKTSGEQPVVPALVDVLASEIEGDRGEGCHHG